MIKAIRRLGVIISILAAFAVPSKSLAQIAPTASASITGSVADSTGKPVANALVTLHGPRNATTHTDTQGLFAFVGAPFGTYSISAAAAGLGTATRSNIVVQNDINVAIQYTSAAQSGLRTIASVTSSANAGFNITPASITQVNPRANAFNGKTSWRTILEQIPGVAQAGLGSGNYRQAAIPDGPLVPVEISINGALPYETATLLDDMPLIGRSISEQSPGGGTDLAVYPLNAFAVADIVRGPGASSPSIVGSIGGSFVLHAPVPASKNAFELSLTNDPYGGMIENALSALRFGKASVTLTFGVNNSPGPINTSGIPAVTTARITQVDGGNFVQFAPPCVAPSCVLTRDLVNPNYGGTNPVFNQYGYQLGLLVCCTQQTTAWTQHTGSIALSYALSPAINAEIFYAGDKTLAINPGSYETDTFIPPAGYSGPIAPGSQVLSLVGAELGPFVVTQGSNLVEEKITARLGNGSLRLSALQNRSGISGGYNAPSTPTLGLQLYGGGTLNGSPVVFNGSSHTVTFAQSNFFANEQANNRDLLAAYETPLGERYHAGASIVHSYYNGPSSQSLGSVSFVLPSAVSQTTNEARVFVGGNISDKMSLDLSEYLVRANYHTPSSTNTVSPLTLGANLTYTDINFTYAAPRLGLVWRPRSGVAIRASAGGGLAVSALCDLVGTVPANAGTFFSQVIPNPNLQPEKSFAFDLGTDVRIRRDTTVSFDVYRANLFGQLYSSVSLADPNYQGTGKALYVTQFQNLGTSRYEGLLFSLRHTPPLGLYWSLSGGLTRGYVISVPPGFYNATGNTCNFTTLTGCVNLNVVPGINFNGRYTVGPGGSYNAGSVPYAQGLGVVGYHWAPDKFADLTATYYGNNNTYFHPAFLEFDGRVGYGINKNFSLMATFRNITGIYGSAVQLKTFSSFMGVPSVAGPPFSEVGEVYGPRTIMLTTDWHI